MAWKHCTGSLHHRRWRPGGVYTPAESSAVSHTRCIFFQRHLSVSQDTFQDTKRVLHPPSPHDTQKMSNKIWNSENHFSVYWGFLRTLPFSSLGASLLFVMQPPLLGSEGQREVPSALAWRSNHCTQSFHILSHLALFPDFFSHQKFSLSFFIWYCGVPH